VTTNTRELKHLAQAVDARAIYTGAWNRSSIDLCGSSNGDSDPASAINLIGMMEQMQSEQHALIENEHAMTLSSKRCDLTNSTLFVASDEIVAIYDSEFSSMHVDAVNSAIRFAIDQKLLAVVVVAVHDACLAEQVKTRLKTEHELLRAINEDQFVIHYQPRVDTMSGEMVGMEALVRWMHPERGLLPPDDFIPLAESTGLIVTLGALVMSKVCAQIVSWQAQRIPLVPVSVNVSACQFNEGTVEQLVALCLAEHGIPPYLLEIELTESAMIGDVDSAIHEISAINALGIKVHIDDFGTGYSTLSLLHKIKMNVLKVDRAFTSELGKGKQAEIFFKAIVSMAKALGMSVVAEGGETEEQVRILQNLCCDELQGNFVSRPLSAEDIPEVLQKRFLFS
jgi:EAL domain-containing protein (putative c-di-GMP-specific phosphodiesterase class I)